MMPQRTSASDEEIVAHVLAGAAARFEVLMRRHNQRLFRAARAILRNDAEAEDAVQQAYISAYEHLAQFHGGASFATWLTRITIHAALGRRRKLQRRAEVGLEPQRESEAVAVGITSAPRADPESEAAGHELRVLVEAAIDALPEMYRLTFVLREIEQLSTAEAAACLEVSEEVVKVRLHRAKAMLRRTLAADVEAPYAFLGARCDRLVERVLAELARSCARPTPR